MQSHFEFININQVSIRRKLQLFLTHLNESLPDWAEGGLCNGFSFMMFRADAIGEADKFLSRLHTLATADIEEIKNYAVLYETYRTHIKSAESKLKISLSECKDTTKHKEIREWHYDGLHKEMSEKLSIEDQIKLQYAKELYIFISSLLFSFDPNVVKLKLPGRYASQNDYLSILDVIPPDQFLDSKHHVGMKKNIINKVLSFNFNYNETEFIETLKKIIKDNDQVAIYYSHHIIYVTRKNGMYRLYDPNSKGGPIEFNSCDEMVPKIKAFFIRLIDKLNSHHMPIGVDIYSTSKKEYKRSSVNSLIHDIFEKRASHPNIDAQGWSKETSLYVAAKNGNSEVVHELLARYADPYVEDNLGGTAVLLAASNGHLNVLKVMNQFNVSFSRKNKENVAPIHMAATWGQMDALQFLLAKKVDINVQDDSGFTAAMYAAKGGYADALELLIAHGADLELEDKNGRCVEFFATKYGHVDILNILEKNKVNLNKTYQDEIILLSTAAHYGKLDAVKFFIKQKNTDINKPTMKNGNTPLHRAVLAGHVAVVETLIECKADLNTKNKDGLTPLLLAVHKGKASVVQTLGKYLNFDAEDKQHQTALLKAAEIGQENVIKVMMEQKSVDLNKANKLGITPVFAAAQKGKVGVLKLLSEAKSINFGVKNNEGMTPFMAAAKQGHQDVIEFYIHYHPQVVLFSLLTAKDCKDINVTIKKELLNQRKLLVNELVKWIKNLEEVGERQKCIHSIRNQHNALGILLNTFPNSIFSKVTRLFDSSKYLLDGKIVTEYIFELLKQLESVLTPKMLEAKSLI